MKALSLWQPWAWLIVNGYKDVENRSWPTFVRGSVLIHAILISTVWLGLDHSWGGEPPLIFETMIFDCEELDGYQKRYNTEEEALEGHEEAVALVMETERIIEGECRPAPNLLEGGSESEG